MNDRDEHYMKVAIECELMDILSEIEKSDDEYKESLRDKLINNFIDIYKNSFPSATEEEFRKTIDMILEKNKKNKKISRKGEVDVDDDERE